MEEDDCKVYEGPTPDYLIEVLPLDPYEDGDGERYCLTYQGEHREETLGYFESLEEALQTAGDHLRGIRYVVVYLVDQAYGGPEEGGWWYSCGEVILNETHPSSESAEARRLELEASEDYTNEGRRSITSVLSEGRYEIRVQATPGEHWPRRKPHYC